MRVNKSLNLHFFCAFSICFTTSLFSKLQSFIYLHLIIICGIITILWSFKDHPFIAHVICFRRLYLTYFTDYAISIIIKILSQRNQVWIDFIKEILFFIRLVRVVNIVTFLVIKRESSIIDLIFVFFIFEILCIRIKYWVENIVRVHFLVKKFWQI